MRLRGAETAMARRYSGYGETNSGAGMPRIVMEAEGREGATLMSRMSRVVGVELRKTRPPPRDFKAAFH